MIDLTYYMMRLFYLIFVSVTLKSVLGRISSQRNINALPLYHSSTISTSEGKEVPAPVLKQQKPIVTPPPDFTAPIPQLFSITNGDFKGAITGSLALALRLATGVFVVGWTPFRKSSSSEVDWPGTLGIFKDSTTVLNTCNRPEKPVILYEYEASPFCRKVREACSMLDLVVEYRPCPGARFGWSDSMSLVTEGLRTVPFMIDPNAELDSEANKGMFESDDIISYLFDTYGPGKDSIPWTLKGDFAVYSSIFAAQVRGFAGSKPFPEGIRDDVTSLEPIVVWGYEGSPFVRPVRETLNSLGLAHVMVYCPRGSQNRDKMFRKVGRFQVPYIEDPNTGISLFESVDIVNYLRYTYTPKNTV